MNEFALRAAAASVADASEGYRNYALGTAAFKIRPLIRAGELIETEVVDGLWGAALAAGLHDREIETTIRSAFAASDIWGDHD